MKYIIHYASVRNPHDFFECAYKCVSVLDCVDYECADESEVSEHVCSQR